jgi:hypothetical protein
VCARQVIMDAMVLRALSPDPQVRLFSNRDHIRAFTAGDVMAVVGWSQDIITLAERSNSVEVRHAREWQWHVQTLAWFACPCLLVCKGRRPSKAHASTSVSLFRC